MEFNLDRFLDAHRQSYDAALREISSGRKLTHWMWFIFPQLKGLGRSETALYYGIENIAEAEAYLAHEVLGKHLVEISEALLSVENKSANAVFGYPDDLKLHSSMTLFSQVQNSNPVFRKVLDNYFNGADDGKTMSLLKQ
ncbi:MAG: DUF1810 domain-containing protein [Flavobacterium sp.]|nr:MAG: DUF1810 domain-containing protein [Flavobacterium sp.]